MRAKLLVIGGKANREEIKLKLPTIIGRSRQAGVCIAHPMVSRQHCELYEENDKIYVRDLGSLNGTLVADSQVQRFCLEHGDTLTVGPLTFQVVYEHLGAIPAIPAQAPKTDEDSAIGQVEPPELAQTMVDLPKVGAAPEEDLTGLSPEASHDDGFDLALPAVDDDLPPVEADELAVSAEEDDFFPAADEDFAATAELPELAAEDDSEPLKLFDGEEDDLTPASESAPTMELSLESLAMEPEVAALDDELAFDLSPAPEAASDATDEVAEAPELKSAPVEPHDAEDDFLDFLSDAPVAASAPPAAEIELEDAVASIEPAPMDVSSSEPTATVDSIEDEIDWLSGETKTVELSADDLAELAMEQSPSMEAAEEDLAAELSFDEDATVELPEAPIEETPVAIAPAPAEPKKKRGLWPFGRKKKEAAAADETTVEAPTEALELTEETVEVRPLVESIAGDETVVMDALDIVAIEADDTINEVEPELDLNVTQELAHETTVILDDSVDVVEEANAQVATPRTPEIVKKPKRGLFGFGKKSKSPAAEPVVEFDAQAEAEAIADAPADAETVAEAPAEAGKKKGWFSFGKRGKAEAKPAAVAAPEPKPAAPAAPVAPAAASPNPESFEFSDDELLEITAEGDAPVSGVGIDPQALAADETLDFELDLPLHDSSASIQPVLSDEPPPTTGADDDDFLDFLAEELPGPKQRGAG
jgi:hypothetical protein